VGELIDRLFAFKLLEKLKIRRVKNAKRFTLLKQNENNIIDSSFDLTNKN
jgi:hypothetical protein